MRLPSFADVGCVCIDVGCILCLQKRGRCVKRDAALKKQSNDQLGRGYLGPRDVRDVRARDIFLIASC